MEMRITCYKESIPFIKEILEKGLLATGDPFGGCRWNCIWEEKKCLKCIKDYVNNKIEWYDLDTEGIRHDENGEWHFYRAERIKNE